MKVICIGHAAYDITIPVEKFITENTKNRLEGLLECGGGPANNAAYLLGKWGMDVTFMGVIGNDEYGKYIKKELESVNVDTRYIQVNDRYKTTSSFIIANMSTGSRTILTYRSNKLKLTDVNIDFRPDIILVDGQEPEMSKKIIKENPNAISIIDAGRPTDEIIELAKMVDYVVCSKEFAETVADFKFDDRDDYSYDLICQALKQEFNGKIVVTLEDKGCVYEINDHFKKVPGIKMDAIDTTGAGDIFHGAFTYGIAKKLPLEETLKFANIVAGLSVTRLGSKNSMFTLEEIKEKMNECK